MLREKELILLENLKKENARKTEEIRQLRNNQLIGHASGEESITITDGAFAFANILEETEIEVEGEKKKAYVVKLPQGLSKQTTREGYNQFNSEIEIQNIKGVEISYDKLKGYIKLNGTVKTDVAGDKYDSTIFNVKNSGKILVQANIDYTLSIEKISGTYSTNSPLDTSSLIQLWDNSSGAWLYPYQLSFYNLKTSSSVSITKSQTTDVIYNQIQLTLRDRDVFNNLIIGIQFNEGELKPFEQYGETPSIEIPSEIENVKAWNLFDKDNVINDKYVSNDIVSNTSWCYYETNNLSINKKYIVNARTILSFYNEDTNISYLDTQINFDIPISIPENTTKVYISIQKTNLETYMFVEEKDKDKPYAPYGIIPIKLQNKNYFKFIDTEESQTYIGVTTSFYSNKLNINGTSTNGGNPLVEKISKLKKRKYKVSVKLDLSKISVSNKAYAFYFKDVENQNNIILGLTSNTDFNINRFSKTLNLIEDKEINLSLYVNQSGITFNDVDVEFQIEKIEQDIDEATEIVEPQEQNYNLHIGDLELNGIGDIRDSFVVEVDNSYSHKKIKKLYLKKLYNEKVFDTETLNDIDFRQAYTNIEKNVYQYRTIQNFITDLLVNPDPFNIKNISLCNYKKKNGPNDSINNVLNDNLFTVSGHKEIVINSNKPTITDFKNELTELNNNGNPLKILYPLETPELIDLTETYPELVEDIENIINNMFTYEETTHIDTPIGYMELTYTKSNKLIIKNYDDRISALEQAILNNIGGN